MTCRECPGTVYINLAGKKKWWGECDTCHRLYDIPDRMVTAVVFVGFLAAGFGVDWLAHWIIF